MYAVTWGLNMKWVGTDFKLEAGHHWLTAGDGSVSSTVEKVVQHCKFPLEHGRRKRGLSPWILKFDIFLLHF